MDMTLVTDLVSVVTDCVGLFTEAPLVYFVYLALVAVGVGIVKRVINLRSR